MTLKVTIYIGYAFIPNDFSLNPELLTPSQQQRFESEIAHASNKRKRQFYASRLLLNQLSQYYFPSNELSVNEPLTFPYRLIGSNAESRSFNISHSDNWVTVAISEQDIDIGVDIQTLKSDWSPEKARFFCTDDQIQTGLSHPQPDHYFSQLWCQKEAYFKANQSGFFNTESTYDNNFYNKIINTSLFISMHCSASHTAQLQQCYFDENGNIKIK